MTLLLLHRLPVPHQEARALKATDSKSTTAVTSALQGKVKFPPLWVSHTLPRRMVAYVICVTLVICAPSDGGSELKVLEDTTAERNATKKSERQPEW